MSVSVCVCVCVWSRGWGVAGYSVEKYSVIIVGSLYKRISCVCSLLSLVVVLRCVLVLL